MRTLIARVHHDHLPAGGQGGETTRELRTVGLLGLLALGLLVAPRGADAQPAAKVFRVGSVVYASPAEVVPFNEAFQQGLRDLGWVDGQNLTIEWRYAESRPERLPALVAELLELHVDVLFARGPQAVAAARQATRTLPIVAVDMESDPVALGYVTSLTRPGGNITGVFLDLPELSGKQLELLTEVVPAVSRVAVLGDPTINGPHFHVVEGAARALGLHVHLLEVRAADDLECAFDAASAGHARALVVLSPPLVRNHSAQIAALAIQHRLPAITMFREFVEVGGLMAYGSNLMDHMRPCAVLVGKVLHGATPATLPVERPYKFTLFLNLKTAQTLGLTFPPTVLTLADKVIQ